jgi:hypothetical protein
LKYDLEEEIHRKDRGSNHDGVDDILMNLFTCNAEKEEADGDFESARIEGVENFAEPPCLFCKY